MRTHRTVRHGEAGFTLAELLVSMSILGVVMGAVLLTSVSTNRVIHNSEQRLQDTSELRVAVQSLTQNIRPADQIVGSPLPAFRVATIDRVQFTARRDVTEALHLIEYELTGPAGDRSLVESLWLPDDPGAVPDLTYSTLERARTLANPVVNIAGTAAAGGEPMFTFFDGAGNELVPNGAGELDASQRELIASVELFVAVENDQLGRVRRNAQSSTVRIANA